MNQEKPSETLLFALQALEEAEQPDSPVEPDMGIFHNRKGEHCYACLGGLAALKRWSVNPRRVDTRFDIHRLAKVPIEEVEAYEHALDFARDGTLGPLFANAGLDRHDCSPFCQYMADYDLFPEEFKSDLRDMINNLIKAGY